MDRSIAERVQDAHRLLATEVARVPGASSDRSENSAAVLAWTNGVGWGDFSKYTSLIPDRRLTDR